MEEEIKEVVPEEVEEPKKKGKGPLIILILILLGVIGFVDYKYYSRSKEEPLTYQEKAMYQAMIDNYGDEITNVILDYMKENNGSVPEWEDIEDKLITLKDKVSCDVKINYNGSVYLQNCTVSDISYTSNYTYGKPLEEPAKVEGQLYIYKYKITNDVDGVYLIMNQKETLENYNLVTTYDCASANCYGYSIDSNGKNAIIYDDNKNFIYNLDTKEKEIINVEEKQYSRIDFIASASKKYGLVLNNGNNYAFYNLDSKKLVTDYVYNSYAGYQVDELLEKGYFAGIKYGDNYDYVLEIINANYGSLYKSLNQKAGIRSAKLGDKVIYIVNPQGASFDYYLYNELFEPLISDGVEYNYGVNSDGTLTVTVADNNTMFFVYDSDGILLRQSKQYKQVVKVVNDYIAILDDDNNLKLIDPKENEVTTFLKLESKHKLHPLISGWFTTKGKNGVYIVVEDKSISYGTEGAGLEYYYIPTTKETGVIKTNGVGGYAKPVMYFYPTKKTTINVTFARPEVLTTTYPKYENNWTFTAYPNGDLYDKNNKYYYGMYWEELGSTKIDFSEGFYVTKDNAIEFLEETTKKIGFTRREANEFIMYWLKILENNEKSLVYCELTESRNNYNNVIITPTPDSILRVAIHVKKVDGYVKIKEQQLPTFERVGFTVVEWGGTEH